MIGLQRTVTWLGLLIGFFFSIGCAGSGHGGGSHTLKANALFNSVNCMSDAQSDQSFQWIDQPDTYTSICKKLSWSRVGSSACSDQMPNFEKQVVLLLHMGQKKTGGYSLQLDDETFAVSNGVAILNIRWSEPPIGAMVTQAITSPCLAVAVPRDNYSRIDVIDQENRVRWEIPVP